MGSSVVRFQARCGLVFGVFPSGGCAFTCARCRCASCPHGGAVARGAFLSALSAQVMQLARSGQLQARLGRAEGAR